MATVTEARNRAFPAAKIEALIRGGLGEEARDQADLRGNAGAGARTGAYVEPEIDSLVAVTVLTQIEPLVTPIKADESLIRPGGYASVDACVRDIMTQLERRWRKRGECVMGKMEEKVGFARSEAEATDRRVLAERLREAREYVGLSQEEAANYLGVPRTAVTNMETGQRRVEALELKKLARLYKRPVAYFTGESEIERDLPKDVAVLARTASSLSDRDREELRQFAEYLRARSRAEGSRDG